MSLLAVTKFTTQRPIREVSFGEHSAYVHERGDTISCLSYFDAKRDWIYCAPNQRWQSKIFLTGDNLVVCASNFAVHIIKDGKKTAAFALKKTTDFPHLAVVDNLIFIKYAWKAKIEEWGLDGKEIEELKRQQTQISCLSGSETKLFAWSEKAISIYTPALRGEELLITPRPRSKVDKVFVDRSNLLYTFTAPQAQICAVDLTLPRVYEYNDSIAGITAMAFEGGIAYVASTVGTLHGIDFKEGKRETFASVHKNNIEHLAIEGDHLVTGSNYSLRHPAEIKIWHIASRTLLFAQETSQLLSLSYSLGNLVTVEGNAVVCRNSAQAPDNDASEMG